MPRYDYTSLGFYTFDCLAWPFTVMPEGGGNARVQDFTLAVSGAGGTAAIAAAKMGLKTLAVTGLGQDLMGAWVLQRLQDFGVDVSSVQQHQSWRTSSSIVTTRVNGDRPNLHLKGATSSFFVPEDQFSKVTNCTVFHAGGIGLMDAMDHGQNAKLMKAAKCNGCMTTVDVFAGSPQDLPAIAAVLPYTDYFMPSIEEAQALCGYSDKTDMAKFFLGLGAKACALTCGADGAYYHDQTGENFQLPAFDVEVKCTCGCGDAFNAGFAVGLVKDFDMEITVGFAQATSALNATGLGSQAGVESYEHTLAFMKNTATKKA